MNSSLHTFSTLIQKSFDNKLSLSGSVSDPLHFDADPDPVPGIVDPDPIIFL